MSKDIKGLKGEGSLPWTGKEASREGIRLVLVVIPWYLSCMYAQFGRKVASRRSCRLERRNKNALIRTVSKFCPENL